MNQDRIMKKILFVGGRYYPKASPNSICFQNIIDELPEDQYEVSVLCYKDGLEDASKVQTIKISRGFIQTTLYKYEDRKSNISRVIVNILLFLQKIRHIAFYCIWPWCDPIVTLRAIRAAKKANETHHYDIIVAVHMPLSSLIVAHIMKKKYSDIQYIAYFLDSLSGGAPPRFMNEKTYSRKARKWERKLLSNADDIVFMESSRDYHEKTYQNSELASKITYLDLPMLRRRSHMSKEDNNLFVYVGSLAPSVRSPEFFLKVFSTVDDDNWSLVFIGDDTCDILNEYAQKDKRIKVIGRCRHEEAIRYEEKATILINLGNKNPNLTPSKVFEYMSFCKKIVSTYPIDNEPSTIYLKKYPCSLLLDERGDVLEAARKLQSFVKDKQCPVKYEEVEQRFFANTPEAFIHIIEKRKD